MLLARAKPHRHERSASWNPNACCYHLTNPVVDHFKAASREEILQGKSFTSFLFQKALGEPPAIFGRTAEILQRLTTPNPRVAEIGVFRGMNARHLLQQRKDLHLLLVDRWGIGHDESYVATGDFQTRLSAHQWEQVYRDAKQNLTFAPDRCRFLRMSSLAAAHQVSNASLDLVFIDGDHSYEGCKQDIEAWLPKVKPGGWIGGHDYGHWREGRSYGVKKAVDSFAWPAGIETGRDWSWFARC